ncbi:MULTISPECIES: DUF4383 domain-containing protein [unclassified Coleofasciculus]|uniref:DUF4383 domain-containing protein n=1 Tax=Cyanophyceae TaxID=3028117 RepID=UPI0016856A97|nr:MULTISPECIES: DUF4383 domain-containing protein [unclassified Coleofasciculus]MBD1880935.1 DUF4383 domain-containing protein [Coleofasciculus sp. FACHB-T130]MBD1897370.1 DUF4383 domain-containing protein [Coleofasciculus sp. FACHB-129]MBD1901885.1 DUF4383 domain-containing protein [Coleofasciculus sp. FACHB-125]MBD2087235.1 DUF4383 domain-containing protein [Coleofasciculus sp. FACHB-542]MBD2542017.1 DUF4383 domain-containing protein [Coleofasciculus sp. FACHB-SPT36]
MQTSTSQTSTSSVSSIRYAALILGLLFLSLGLAGFMPGFVTPSENFTSEPGFGYIFGVFPTNYFHNAIGVLVGVWGIAAFTSLSGAIVFNRIFAILYAAGAILGLLPFANTLFGLTPLFGNNIWLNALTAAIAFYFGFVKSAEIAMPSSSNAQPSA